jgi:hypothetical protein
MRSKAALAWRVLRVRPAGYLSTPISFGRTGGPGAGSDDRADPEQRERYPSGLDQARFPSRLATNRS